MKKREKPKKGENMKHKITTARSTHARRTYTSRFSTRFLKIGNNLISGGAINGCFDDESEELAHVGWGGGTTAVGWGPVIAVYDGNERTSERGGA